MKTISNLVNEVGGIIDNLSLSTHEKKQIRSSVIDTLYRYASELEKEQASVIRMEAQGNWLQKSWRPLVMLCFTFIILLGVFIPIPLLDDSSEFWNLLEIGLGGYVIGRSVEKVTGKTVSYTHLDVYKRQGIPIRYNTLINSIHRFLIYYFIICSKNSRNTNK